VFLAGRGDGIFQIYNESVGAAGKRLIELLWAIRRNEQE
jgi:hypothetical protein